jgi:hypothetical protein
VKPFPPFNLAVRKNAKSADFQEEDTGREGGNSSYKDTSSYNSSYNDTASYNSSYNDTDFMDRGDPSYDLDGEIDESPLMLLKRLQGGAFHHSEVKAVQSCHPLALATQRPI